MLDIVMQNLPRSNLLDCLEAHWETLKVEGIFAIPSRQVFTWTLSFAEARAKQGIHKQTRQSGESNSADNGDSIPGLGLGLLLLCGPAVAKKMSYAHTCKKNLLICITVISW